RDRRLQTERARIDDVDVAQAVAGLMQPDLELVERERARQRRGTEAAVAREEEERAVGAETRAELPRGGVDRRAGMTRRLPFAVDAPADIEVVRAEAVAATLGREDHRALVGRDEGFDL